MKPTFSTAAERREYEAGLKPPTRDPEEVRRERDAEKGRRRKQVQFEALVRTYNKRAQRDAAMLAARNMRAWDLVKSAMRSPQVVSPLVRLGVGDRAMRDVR